MKPLKKFHSRDLLPAVIAVLLFLPNLFNRDINPVLAYDKKEKFDPAFGYINSISALEAYTDSLAAAENISPSDYHYVELLETVIKKRFYHGFSHFTLSENWIAALAGKYIKEDYACKVQPEKIIKEANAACSQQALVMMAVLRNKNISYRSIGFPHHYAMEVQIDNNWYFFDANMEPDLTKQQRMLSSWNHRSDSLKKYYSANRFTDLEDKFGSGLIATTGTINEIPAKNARIFQCITAVLSRLACFFPILLIFYRPRFSVKRPFISLRFKKSNPALALSVYPLLV